MWRMQPTARAIALQRSLPAGTSLKRCRWRAAPPAVASIVGSAGLGCRAYRHAVVGGGDRRVQGGGRAAAAWADFNLLLVVQFAQQNSVPIVPVMMQENWRPSEWLGLITAGLLWYVIFWLSKKVSDREVLEGQTSSAIKTAGWGVFFLVFFAKITYNLLFSCFFTYFFWHSDSHFSTPLTNFSRP